MGDPEQTNQNPKKPLLLGSGTPVSLPNTDTTTLPAIIQIPEKTVTVGSPSPNTPESSNQPVQKPDFAMFIGIIGVLLAVLIPILQMNGLEINWEWSAFSYLVIIVGAVWTFLVHAVPHRGKIIQIIGSFVIVAAFGTLAVIATFRRYQIQHPKIPMLSIFIQTIPGLPEGIQNNSHLRYNFLSIRNDNDIEIENFYGRIQLPEPISITIETNLPPGTAIDWKPLLTEFAVKGIGNRTTLGPGSTLYPIYQSPTFIFPAYSAQLTEFSDGNDMTGAWQLLIDKLPPHKAVTISFLTTDEGEATNYIALANYEFKTNGATIMAILQQATNGSAIIHKSLIAFIIHTNKVVKPDEDWHLGTNELRFCFEGIFQHRSADKEENQHFLVPFIFETNNRTISSLPIQSENGKWKRVSLEYQ